jgi:ubiquinone/menaquinone biosynthesis C-methylase UbiE
MSQAKTSARLVEIGCGQGVAVSLVCDKLESGNILAIDHSEKMIAMAQKRNAAHVKSGKASFQTVSLAGADFGEVKFDKIFAIRVGIFAFGQPARELEVIRNCLAVKGSFYLIYDPPQTEQVEPLTGKMRTVLEKQGFTVKEVRTRATTGATVICIIAGKG